MSLGPLVEKARGRSPAFLAWKAADTARHQVRSRLPPRLLYGRAGPRVAAELQAAAGGHLREHLLERSEPRFFFSQPDVKAILDECPAEHPGYRDAVVDRATEVRAHRLRVLSLGTRDLGDPIDWHRDYRSGMGWPLEPSGSLDIYDAGRPTDVRIVWELNRLHFLVDLAKAYRSTGDDEHATALARLVRSWDGANPVGYGVNWTCAMEAAIRAVNLIWAVYLALPSPGLDEPFLERLVGMLAEHGAFVRSNLERSDIAGNHYVADLVGLVWIGLFLPESETAARWLAYSVPRLEHEIRRQVYPDGASHEGSIPYHRLVVELFFSTGLLLERNGRPLSRGYWQTVERMADFIAAYVKPDGECPLFGDTDDGRLHVLGGQPVNDHRYLLAVAAARFDRPDLAAAAGGHWEEAAWLLGPAAHAGEVGRPGARPAPARSRSFPDGGWYFLRGGSSYAAIDCGDVGLRGRGGHGHCDVLSVELAFGGESVVVDRGCSSYTAGSAERIDLLLAASHNTVVIDGVDYGRVLPFRIPGVGPTPWRALSWDATEGGPSVFEGEHHGYRGLGIVHRRRLEVHPDGRVVIADTLDGAGAHSVVARFHLAPGAGATAEGAACRIRTRGGREVVARVTQESGQGTWTVSPTTCYPSYGVAVPSLLAEWSRQVDLPTQITFEWTPTA